MRTLIALLTLATHAVAQPARTREGVERALDQAVRFELPEATIDKACAALARATGVDIYFSPDALQALPFGGDTKVTVTLRNTTLREGLNRLLAPLGMSFETSDRGIEVRPHPALVRLGGRRPGWPELDTLRALREANWSVPASSAAMQRRLQFRVPSAAPWTELSSTLVGAGAAPGDEALTRACDARGWTWFPQGENVVILPLRDQMQRMLRGRVSVRLSHKPLIDVLEQLARQANVPIRVEEGAVAALPLQTRENFSLLAERISVSEALDQIAAATGLGYRVEGEGVVFHHPGGMGPQPERAAAIATRSADPVVAKLVLPPQLGGLQLEIIIRESELSPEANEARKKFIKDANEIFIIELNRRAANE